MKKLNGYLALGLALNATAILSSRYNLLPDFAEGVCVGLGLVLIFRGMLDGSNLIIRLSNFKKNIIKKTP
ncbi:MAG TPA: hypothetical protein VJ888_06605 [Mobilitalea sp.]|nr:hypothetical protein [Mobilitalea sp.]